MGKIFFLGIVLLFALVYLPDGLFIWGFFGWIGIMMYMITKTDKPKVQSEPVPNAIPVEQVRLPVNNGMAVTLFFILGIVNLYVVGIMLGGGWELLLIGPFILVGVLIYLGTFSRVFRKYGASSFTVYATLFLCIFSFLSLKLNSGVATDAEIPSYILEFWLGIGSGLISTSARTLFGVLNTFGVMYFLLASVYVYLTVKAIGSISKATGYAMILIAAAFPAIHVGYFLVRAPELRTLQEAKAVAYEQKETENNTLFYTKTVQQIQKTTFVDRLYSFFIIEPKRVNQDNECPYTMDYTSSILELYENRMSFSVACAKKFGLYGARYFPYATSTQMSVNLPFDDLKKGEIIAMVVKMDAPSYFRINVEGNNATRDALRMPPFFYDGLETTAKIGDTVYHEKSIVQFANERTSKTIMVLYPINVDIPVATMTLDIGMYTGTTTPGTVEVAEISRIQPNPFVEPEWLKEWGKEPNPFLK